MLISPQPPPPYHHYQHHHDHFSAVWSPRFWVSGYCTRWQIQGSFDSSYERLLNIKTYCQETQYLASILSDTFIKCICHNTSCTLGKWSLHSRWNFISAFTELHVHGGECWPVEVTSNTYFRGVTMIYTMTITTTTFTIATITVMIIITID